MTVTEIASRLNVTTMTVYRRLKKAGLNIADYRDESNNLTADGVAIIGNLFNGTDAITGDTTTTTDDVTQVEHETQPDTQLLETAVKLAELTAKLDGLKATLEQVQDERDRLRVQVDTLTQMLQAEQQQRERLLLASGTVPGTEPATTSRRWKWPWQR